MALHLRQKQLTSLSRMLHLDGELFKILIVDTFCDEIISNLISDGDLRHHHGVTLYASIHNKNRGTVSGSPAVYFLRPDQNNFGLILRDASRALYDSFYFNFSSSLPRAGLEDLALGALRGGCVERIERVFDQYLDFVALEDDMFSIGQPECYVRLNDPVAGEREIEEVVERIVSGLFCMLVTLGVVPVIRCPRGGAAEMVAAALDRRLRDHLGLKNNLFSQAGNLGSSLQRPVLCVFDRNFDILGGVQHDFRYRPLVHEVFGLKIDVETAYGKKELEKELKKKPYRVNVGDPFWVENGSLEFPEIALEIERQVNASKKSVEEVNKMTGGEGEAEFDGMDLIVNTRHLMNVVNALPERIKKKQIIEIHTNIATKLLSEIKERSLDVYAKKENDMLAKGGIDQNELLSVLGGKGTKMDKLRFAITYLLSSDSIPKSEVETVEAALRESDVDTCAFQYVKKIKSLNISLASANSASKSNIVDWAEKLYGQSISAVTAGMKNLLSSDRQLALTRTVEALMEGRPDPQIESYLVFDPRAPKSSSGSTSSHLKGPFKEAIVFMIGGGNYVEYEGLQELVRNQEPVRHIVYGTTEVLTGEKFVEQLSLLGQKMGLGTSA